MPSWVLPAVAAELWGTSVGQVMEEVVAGRVPSRREGEFLFVDVDPAGVAAAAAPTPVSEEPRPAPPYRRPLTWAFAPAQGQADPLVTAAEREALLEEGAAEDEDHDPGDAPAAGELTPDDVPDWEQVRARVSRTRVPPGARRAA